MTALSVHRRIDWRFLLPEPLAGTLLVGGSPDAELFEALNLLPGVTVVTEPRPADVLHLIDPTPADLQRLLPSLRPGGVLYAEVSRHGLRPGSTPAAWARAVRRAGLTGVQVHWHAPDFVARTRIVPCDHRAAVLDTLARQDGRRMGRLQAAVGSGLQRVGLLGLAIPHGSVLARQR